METAPPRSSSLLTNLTPFFIGGVSGAFATLVIQPLDTFKVQIQITSEKLGLRGQASSLSSLAVLKEIARNQQGLTVFYRGLDSAILRQLFYASARLGFYNSLSDLYKQRGGTVNNSTRVLLSTISGALGALIGNPFDVALIRRQASISDNNNTFRYRNTLHALSSIVRNEGVLHLWTGINITILRVVLINIGQLASHEIIKENLQKINYFVQNPAALSVTSALSASFLTSLISLPADNIKVKLQKSAKGQEGAYRGIFDCLRQTIVREGVTKLWVGFPVYLLRGAPHSFILITTQEYLKKAFSGAKLA